MRIPSGVNSDPTSSPAKHWDGSRGFSDVCVCVGQRPDPVHVKRNPSPVGQLPAENNVGSEN